MLSSRTLASGVLAPKRTADNRASPAPSEKDSRLVLDRMQARLAARPEILKQRREIAEHRFGSIKQWMNQGGSVAKILLRRVKA